MSEIIFSHKTLYTVVTKDEGEPVLSRFKDPVAAERYRTNLIEEFVQKNIRFIDLNTLEDSSAIRANARLLFYILPPLTTQ